jgi:hypothetical protein
MRLSWTPEFSRQMETHGFCYTCPDCAYYVVERKRCAHEWPLIDHQIPHRSSDEDGREIVFCKEFELP